MSPGNLSARFALLHDLELSMLPEEILRGPNLALELRPASGLSLAAALKCLRASSLAGDPTIKLVRSGLAAVGFPSAQNSTVEAGAAAPIAAVEAELQGRGLTLGPLCPSVREGTVADWVEGPHGALRAIPGGRLEPAVLAMEVALRSGTLYRSRPSPRSAAGPDLDNLFLGGQGRIGLLASATLRAFPKPGYQQSAMAWASDAPQVVAILRSSLAHEALPAAAQVRREGQQLRIRVSYEGFRYRVARDVASFRAAVVREGGRDEAGAPPASADSASPGAEHEVDWEALPAALELVAQTGAQLHRLARESVVLCSHLPLAGDGIAALGVRAIPPPWFESISSAPGSSLATSGAHR